MRVRLLVLTLLAFAASCSNRERANPLDPSNPDTGGRPAGFNAVAGFTVVSLSWTLQPSVAIDGFLLERLAPGDSLWRPIGGLLSPGTSFLADATVRNGSTYRYRLYYVIGGKPGKSPAEDVATPGPLRAWVADAGAGVLDRLSPDGRDVVSTFTDAGDVQSLGLDPSTGRVWTSARFAGLVTSRVPGDLEPLSFSGFSQPYTMAVSPIDHSAWVCELAGSVAHVAVDGSRLPPGTIDLLDLPTGIAISPRDRSVWVCENGGSRVRHFDPVGTPLSSTSLPAPSRVAVDSVTGQAIVTSVDMGRIWRLSIGTGTVLDSSVAAAGPLGIAIDRRHDLVWIADAVGSRVLALDPVTLAVRFTVTGIPEPRDLAVDLDTGEAWVVARASREIVRIAPDGTVLQRLGGFTDPTEIRLDPGN